MLRGGRRLLASAIPSILPGNVSLQDHDPEIYKHIRAELRRQVEGLELIASENFTSRAVLECLGSITTNKYAEGLPGARYYGGTECVDAIENVCRDRALQAFRLDARQWAVNVQPYSGSPANFAALSAMLQPHERLMGLDLPSGGHLTHGFYTQTRKVSASSLYFESLPYKINSEGFIDYDELERLAMLFKPKLIIAGGSAYPRDWDYKRYRQVCNQVGAKLMVDMAHYSGLVATQLHNDPFEFADIVTTTTHKSLRGPRSGLIFIKKSDTPAGQSGPNPLEERMNNAVFPLLQGGPHMHQVAAVATQLREVMTPAFKLYSQQVKANAAALAAELVKRGYTLSTGGTDNHLMLLNLRPLGLTGNKMEKLFDHAHVTVNKNSIVGDVSAVSPSGLRLGTPALTTRGFTEEHFGQVAEFLHRGIQIGLKLQKPGDKLVDFVAGVKGSPDVKTLSEDVKVFSAAFPFPGFENPFPLK